MDQNTLQQLDDVYKDLSYLIEEICNLNNPSIENGSKRIAKKLELILCDLHNGNWQVNNIF